MHLPISDVGLITRMSSLWGPKFGHLSWAGTATTIVVYRANVTCCADKTPELSQSIKENFVFLTTNRSIFSSRPLR